MHWTLSLKEISSTTRMLMKKIFIFIYVVFLTGTAWPQNLQPNKDSKGLPLYTNTTAISGDKPQMPLSRFKPVRINIDALEQTIVNPSTHLILPLFNGEKIEVYLTHPKKYSVHRSVWVGKIMGDDTSEVIFARYNNALVGKIAVGSRRFLITTSSQGTEFLVEVPADFGAIKEDDAVIPPNKGAAAVQKPKAAATTPDDGSRVDVFVGYTAAARDGAGGVDAIKALADAAIAEANVGNDNSQVNFDFAIVGTGLVNYDEAGQWDPAQSERTNWDRMLARLVNKTDGFMDEIVSFRDNAQADIVMLFIEANQANGIAGLAYIMGTPSTSFEYFAMSLVKRVYAVGGVVAGHEMGHNMGSDHDRQHPSGQRSYLYSYGYRPSNGAFATIMAYQDTCPGGGSCPKINYYSNPDITYNGQAIGIDYEADPANAADNARSLNNTAPIVANFRTPVECQPPLPDTAEWILYTSCTISGSVVRKGNVAVFENATLTIAPTGSLDLDLVNFSLYVFDGGAVVIKDGGKIY